MFLAQATVYLTATYVPYTSGESLNLSLAMCSAGLQLLGHYYYGAFYLKYMGTVDSVKDNGFLYSM